MRDSVRAAFIAFTTRFEGRVPWMYEDIDRGITVGLGCLLTSLAQAQGLPWQDMAGGPATADSVAWSWGQVRGATYLATHGGAAYETLSNVRLSNDAIDALAMQRLAAEEAIVSGLAGYEAAPAPAGLAILGMAWACGAEGVLRGFPRFCAAFSRGDWGTCALECRMDDSHNPGLTPRNRATSALFAACLDSADPDSVPVVW